LSGRGRDLGASAVSRSVRCERMAINGLEVVLAIFSSIVDPWRWFSLSLT
jgi:hypothetical protein